MINRNLLQAMLALGVMVVAFALGRYLPLRESKTATTSEDRHPSATSASQPGTAPKRAGDPAPAEEKLSPAAAQAAIEEALKIENLETKRSTVIRLVDNWLANDPHAAAAWISTIKEPDLKTFLIQKVVETNVLDEKSTLEFILAEMPEGPGILLAASNLLAKWIEKDPAAAAAGLAQMPASGASANITGQLARNWLVRDSKAASEWLFALPEGQARHNAVKEYVTLLAGGDPEGAAAEISTWKGSDAAVGLNALVSSWGQSEPASAAAYVSRIADPATRQQRMAEVVSMWVRQDAPAAAAWVGNLPAEEKPMVVENLVSQWAAMDIDRAKSWVDQLPQSPTRDLALMNLAGVEADEDVMNALAWTSGIVDNRTRSMATVDVLSKWKSREPDAVSAWVWGTSWTMLRKTYVLEELGLVPEGTHAAQHLKDDVKDTDHNHGF